MRKSGNKKGHVGTLHSVNVALVSFRWIRVSSAEVGDLIEFVHPWSGLSLWGVYTGEGCVVHFGVGGKKLKCGLYLK